MLADDLPQARGVAAATAAAALHDILACAAWPAVRSIPTSRSPSSRSRSSSAGASATSSPSRCAAARAPSRGSSDEGPPTANGRPGVAPRPRARRSRTSTRATRRCAATTSSARAAGTATACRSRSPSSSSSGCTTSTRSRPTGSRSSTRSAASRCSSYLEDWNRLTERIGFWVDLDDAYRTLDTDYIESVWWALRQIYDKGLLYEGHKVVPYCPRCGTALSSHELALGYQRRRRPVGLRALPGRRGRRPAAGRRRAARVDDDAVDAGVQRGGRRRPRADLRARQDRRARGAGRRSPRRCVERVLGRTDPDGVQILAKLPGRGAGRRRATSRRSPTSRARSTASAATPCCSATSSPPTTAPASCTRRSPSARTTSASARSTG